MKHTGATIVEEIVDWDITSSFMEQFGPGQERSSGRGRARDSGQSYRRGSGTGTKRW